MTQIQLNKLANKINYLLDQNGGCTDEYILELMHTYKIERSRLIRKQK